MTTVYIEYKNAVTNGIIDLSNVKFSVMLCENYIPQETDILKNISSISMIIPNVILENEINTLTMDSIRTNIFSRIYEYINSNNFDTELKNNEITEEFLKGKNINNMVLYSLSSNTLCFCEEL